VTLLLALPILWIAAWTGDDFVWRGTGMRAQRRADLATTADSPNTASTPLPDKIGDATGQEAQRANQQ
jgi:hypothetical protein